MEVTQRQRWVHARGDGGHIGDAVTEEGLTPMPMNTTLRMGDRVRACTSCSTISPAVRSPLRPIVPVAQNVHPIAHPTCPHSSSNTLHASSTTLGPRQRFSGIRNRTNCRDSNVACHEAPKPHHILSCTIAGSSVKALCVTLIRESCAWSFPGCRSQCCQPRSKLRS